ncbi:hypothetical protein LTR62_003417 [Meristemomyces frigidus]|uniref:rRNA adenine N(6)-methyltransferase n=1 Tax=Meristemomyces frigidus TaxID=1508187 RepID=A0AAN7TS28_9PEZI|nr:hypothetical protein LTR62_003417 [Meristemomyces frigidus]
MVQVSRFAVDPRYPITRILAKLFQFEQLKPLKTKKIAGLQKPLTDHRNDIVSEKLCDDTLSYLAPTLEQYKGCTLIDINPGACLFSTKLHALLKPKRHLLLEPEPRYYDDFIKPLLDLPGSKYRHTDLPGVHMKEYFHHYKKIHSDPELAPRQGLPIDDPRQRKLDTSFLVLGNLSRRYYGPARSSSVSLPLLLLQQMAQASLNNDIFHNGGLVRMLWWVPENEKYTLLPIAETFRYSLNVRMSVASEMTEVVGMLDMYNTDNAFYGNRRRRPAEIKAMVAQSVKQRMDAAGMKRPEGREFLHGEAEKFDPNSVVSPFEPGINTLRELEHATASAQARLAELTKIGSKQRKRDETRLALVETLARDLVYPQSACSTQTWHWKLKQDHTIKSITIWTDMALRILSLEVALCILREKTLTPQTLSPSTEKIHAMWTSLTNVLSSYPKEHLEIVEATVEMHIACLTYPRAIALEARAYEPLKGEPHEVYPNNQMMLLDMVPKPVDLSVPGLASRREGAKLSELLCRSLMESPSQRLPDALNRLAHNAAQDSLAMVPAATDPRKGGRLDPRNVRTSRVSEEVVEGLVKAWFEWPFRSGMVELEVSRERGVSNGDGEGEVEGGVGA